MFKRAGLCGWRGWGQQRLYVSNHQPVKRYRKQAHGTHMYRPITTKLKLLPLTPLTAFHAEKI